DVDVALGHQQRHLAVEERQQQRADVLAVHVGVGEDDDALVAELLQRLLDLLGVEVHADVDADGGDEAGDLLVLEQVLDTGLLDVQRLASQRQDGLILAGTALLGAAAGAVALDEEQLAAVAVLVGAVHELAGQAAAGEQALAFLERLAERRLLLAGLGLE